MEQAFNRQNNNNNSNKSNDLDSTIQIKTMDGNSFQESVTPPDFHEKTEPVVANVPENVIREESSNHVVPQAEVSTPNVQEVHDQTENNKTARANEVNEPADSFTATIVKGEFDKRRERYFKYLINIVEDEHFYQEIGKQNLTFLINFSKYMKNYTEELKNLIGTDEEYKELYLEDIEKCNQRLGMVEELISGEYQQTIEPENQTSTKKNTLIFGISDYPTRKVLFKEDLLKKIPQEYYSHVLELLEGLQTESKVVIESYSGDHIKGLKKVKKGGTGIRLIFRGLTNNMVYVDMILQKKCWANIEYIGSLENRKARLDNHYKSILARIKSGDNIEELIAENEMILEDIKSVLRKEQKQDQSQLDQSQLDQNQEECVVIDMQDIVNTSRRRIG